MISFIHETIVQEEKVMMKLPHILFAALLVMAGLETGANALDRCTPQVMIPAVISSVDQQSARDLGIVFGCTSDNPGALTSVDITAQINASVNAGPSLFVDDPLCFHLGNSIICPPGVPPGSNSIQFNPDGTVLFPGFNGTTVSVPPSGIIPNPFPIKGQQTAPGRITWFGVPIIEPSQSETRSFGTMLSVVPRINSTNEAIELTLEPSETMQFDNPTVPLAIVATDNPVCDESFLSITPGYSTFVFARNISFNGGLYTVTMPIVTLTDGSPGLGVSSVWQGDNCPNSGNSLTLDGVLNLGKVNVNGLIYSAKFQWTGAGFKLASVH